VLVVLGVRFFFPPAEYIIGGKDPGTYMNEGIQIAQRGSLVVRDPVVASVPAASRDLFFPSHKHPAYHSNRFMGFFIMDPDTGAVVGQFPQLYPASIAIAYGIDGLTGARRAVGFWGIFGLLALYFAGARLVGAPAAAAGAVLLAMNEVQIWFARYPNAELALQALLFAALLALARAHIDDDRFFEPIAGVLFSLLLFLRPEGWAALAVAAVAVAMTRLDGRRVPKVMTLVTIAGLVLAAWYWTSVIRAYGTYQIIYTWNIGVGPLTAAAVLALVLVTLAIWAGRRPEVSRRARDLIPTVLIVLALTCAAYAYFPSDEALCEHVADLMAGEKVVGWLQGRMEFGPRALGGRSIIGDARSPKMQSVMNLKIKFRESFRPFAPSVLEERVDDYFETRPREQSPYMLLVAPVRETHRLPVNGEYWHLKGIEKLKMSRSDVPAITHVDFSARVQTVDPDRHGRYYKLLRAFERKSGCPVVINTSFNVRGEPIVCTPEDAYRCFLATNMDVLVLERFVLLKEQQAQAKPHEVDAYLAQFQLD